MSETSVLCIGEALVELSFSPEQPDSAGIGFAGDTLNTAIYLRRTAPELRVAYATKLGTDELSDRIVAMQAAEGIDTSYISRSKTRAPGIYAISTDRAGERTFTYWRDRSAARTMMQPPGLERDALDAFDLVYLSAITLAILPSDDRATLIGWLGDYRAGGGNIAFDSNYRPELWSDSATARKNVEAAWRITDIALPGLGDEMNLFGDADEAAVLARLASFGITSGALKRGPRGPRAMDGTEISPKPAPRVVDSTAAGDSFNAGYLAARFTGASEAEALCAGHALAARVIGHRGAIMPRNAP